MANIFDIQLPDGTKYNFADARIPVATSSDENKIITVDSSGNYILGEGSSGAGALYGTCSTGASTVAKEVLLSDSSISELTAVTGMTIFVKFTNTNTASQPTMTVKDSTGTTTLISAVNMRLNTNSPIYKPEEKS